MVDLWPVFGLHVGCGPLELDPIRDADIPALVDLAAAGIHDAEAMPFAIPWSTSPDLPRTMSSYYWRTRAEFGEDGWSLDLAVRWHGQLVGCQGFATQHYLVTRTGETGSWLGRPFQRQGIGTLMRQAICVFLFDHLDAAEVTSGAWLDNAASLGVSRKVGYEPNGQFRQQRRAGELSVMQKLRLRPDRLVRPPYDVQVEGADAVRQVVGLQPGS
jgi:RimJ/RimL family protein N-acetyltransferase